MVVVGDIIEVYKAAHEIILETLLLGTSVTKAHGLLLVRAQMLDEQVSVDWLVVDTRSIELKRMEAGAHLALRYYKNARNINGLLHNETGSLVQVLIR